ncbi:HAD hydrolase-like protein [Nonomuraea phyllanthi]|uniref:HAD family hydrolase n=1 Tax=Nonomuraea phyllanthi TaxID=2219224 RepID=UPI00129336BC|nr:HAD family hydrolase [Nonomuraea phyllanthi]QFY10476.1 HAD hydrolase-like protein [Nonomuraea phyllanthi]
MAIFDLTTLRAVVFDTDGVVTDTARVHAAAWKHVFDAYLRGRCEPFDVRADYLAHVDGRPRLDAVRAFLASRGLSLPEGGPGDEPGAATVYGLWLAEDALFAQEIGRHGVSAFPAAVTLLHELRHRGCRTGAVATGGHDRAALSSAGLLHLFDVLVDGEDGTMPGGPGHDAMFLEAARRLGLEPGEVAIVAGMPPDAPGFGLVVTLAGGGPRTGAGTGAGTVVADLADVDVHGRVPVVLR